MQHSSIPQAWCRRPSAHAPWLIVQRLDCSPDSYILQLQRQPSSPAAAIMRGLASALAPPSSPLACFHVDIGLDAPDGSYIARPYTPLSTEEEYHAGSMRLIVKTYAQGKFTPLLAAQTAGASGISPLPRATPLHTHRSLPRRYRLFVACEAHPGPTGFLLLLCRSIRRHGYSSSPPNTAKQPHSSSMPFIPPHLPHRWLHRHISHICACSRVFNGKTSRDFACIQPHAPRLSRRPAAAAGALSTHRPAFTRSRALQLQHELDSASALMRCTHFFTAGSPSSRVDAQKVLAHAPPSPGAAVVVCGPTGFLEAAR
jgi:hypothetical protein